MHVWRDEPRRRAVIEFRRRKSGNHSPMRKPRLPPPPSLLQSEGFQIDLDDTAGTRSGEPLHVRQQHLLRAPLLDDARNERLVVDID